ncbi:MAG TPA: FIST N-terminal domain-containing protein [Puia sp.]|nr:FIST N-terminal domain-containing protein [Puia sp.]
MKTQQLQYVANEWQCKFSSPGFDHQQAQLVLAFGEPKLITSQAWLANIKKTFPNADIVSSSTAGEIIADEVHDNTIVATAIQFERTTVRCSITNILRHDSSHETGKYLMNELAANDLCSVFVVSDGKHVNGSDLVKGLDESNTKMIPLTGGLAGDGANFQRTFVGLNHLPEEGVVVAIGFYGNSLKTGHGSFGGWDEFGPERVITSSEKNILYQIDGKNALDLYKNYLGPYKEELPGSALLFPLSLTEAGSDQALVRTILSINEEEKSMVFAGNMPTGGKVRLMKANFDKLIDGSSIAAHSSFSPLADNNPQLAILISCVGRKLVLQDRTDEEVQAAKKVFGENTPFTGFYSYGEISPFNSNTRCELHNQTMTITTLYEA